MESSIGKICSSCGRLTSDYTEFNCPVCGKSIITRCKQCRKTYNKYKCKDCGFGGP